MVKERERGWGKRKEKNCRRRCLDLEICHRNGVVIIFKLAGSRPPPPPGGDGVDDDEGPG